MKKLKKLSINKLNVFPIIKEREQFEMKGGTSPFGWQEYYNRYGSFPTGDTGYNPQTDTCYPITENISQNTAPGTEYIGDESYWEMWNRMNEHNGIQQSHYYGPIYQWAVRNLMGGN